jgi:hypothetical protein
MCIKAERTSVSSTITRTQPAGLAYLGARELLVEADTSKARCNAAAERYLHVSFASDGGLQDLSDFRLHAAAMSVSPTSQADFDVFV